MKQYIKDVYSNRHIEILNNHVEFILDEQKKFGYSIRSGGVPNKSEKLFEQT